MHELCQFFRLTQERQHRRSQTPHSQIARTAFWNECPNLSALRSERARSRSETLIQPCTFVTLAAILAMVGNQVMANEREPLARTANAEEIRSFFKARGKKVVTFIGYSDAGYEDQEAMLGIAKNVLMELDPEQTIVNIGATRSGIGAVYGIANQMRFTTTGIVSSQARKHDVELSPSVDHVFYVEDGTWGGFLGGSDELSPTSKAMVEASDLIVGIGGGEVGRDEMIVAKQRRKDVRFFPADMDHQRAIEKARKKGLPLPTNFRGAAGDDPRLTGNPPSKADE